MFPLVTLSLLSTLTAAPSYEIAQSPPSAPAVTTILPADTPLVGLINTKPEAWRGLSRFQLFQTAFPEIAQFLPSNMKIDYAKDVQSWLGDQVAVVLMPQTGSGEVSLDSSFLMLAPVKDDMRLQPFVNELRADKQRPLTERQYKGITILEWIPEPTLTPRSTPCVPKKPKQLTSQQQEFVANPSPVPDCSKPNRLKRQRGLAIALLPGYIVTANTAKPIEQLIDTPKKSADLAQNPQFQRTIQHPQFNQALFTLYQDPAKFLPLAKSISQDPNLPFPLPFPDSIKPEQLKDYSTLDAWLLVQPEGLRFQINAYRQTPKTKQTDVLTPETEQILTRIPAATYSATTGRNLNQQWQTLVALYSADPVLKNWLSQFRNFVQTSTGLNVDRDIMAWMDGEYAFFLFPTKGGLSSLLGPKFNLGISFLVQTNNRPAAETALKKLDQAVKSFSNGLVAIANRNIKGEPVTSWEVQGAKSSQSLFAYSWVDNNTLIVTTGFGAMADLVPQPYLLLSKDYTFTTATSSLPRPNSGYFYMNMGSFLSWVYGFLPPQFNDPYFQTFKRVASSIRSFSTTSSSTAEREQYDGLVVLAPAKD